MLIFVGPQDQLKGAAPSNSGRTKHVKLDGRMNAFLTDRIGELDQQAIVDACNAGDHDPYAARCSGSGFHEPFLVRPRPTIPTDATQKEKDHAEGEHACAGSDDTHWRV